MSINEKLIWRWNRLRCMSIGEIKYRFYNALKKDALKIGLYPISSVPPPDLNESFSPWIKKPTFYLDSQDYCQYADQLLDQGISIFAVKKNFDEIVRDWNSDPKTGVSAPVILSPKLNYLDASVVGDIKYLWEPNRHLFLLPLAQAYQLSGEIHYLNSIERALVTWLDQCPHLKGPNWTSSLELAIRLINWSIIWQLIGGTKSALFKDENGQQLLVRWVHSIYQHVNFIVNNLSFYSSANNHLIGEAAGLFIAATTWPFWQKFETVRKKAFELLENEALRQNAPDGTNREQAVSYQQFVLDFLIMAGLAAQLNYQDFSTIYWRRIETMIEFLASVMDVSGNIPMVGDADDGYVSFLSPEDNFCNYRSLIATGAVLFDRQDFKSKAQHLDHKTCWLMGKKAVEMFTALNTQRITLPVKRKFIDGGYYILGKNFEQKDEVRCIAHCGPLGYLSIAAHGHAAALALYLSICGREILIDPGTYLYHGPQQWRHYFRGTSAHCTVVIDDQDQSKSGGKFMWTRHANAHCEVWEVGDSQDRFVGYHDGYTSLDDPVIHKREVFYEKNADRFIVTDQIECEKTHSVKRFWHFSEDCKVTIIKNRLFIENNGVKVELYSEDTDQIYQLIKGRENPPTGWISRWFDQKTPCYAAVALNRITGSTKLSTIIDIKAISLA
ncbi:MAG: alginate lyase family protein [Desulfobacteraceae bacterium]